MCCVCGLRVVRGLNTSTAATASAISWNPNIRRTQGEQKSERETWVDLRIQIANNWFDFCISIIRHIFSFTNLIEYTNSKHLFQNHYMYLLVGRRRTSHTIFELVLVRVRLLLPSLFSFLTKIVVFIPSMHCTRVSFFFFFSQTVICSQLLCGWRYTRVWRQLKMPASGQTVRILFQVIIWSNLNNVRLILFRVGRTVMVLLLHVMPPKIARVPALCMRSGSFSVRWSSIIINLSVSDSVYGVFSSQACELKSEVSIDRIIAHFIISKNFHLVMLVQCAVVPFMYLSTR